MRFTGEPGKEPAGLMALLRRTRRPPGACGPLTPLVERAGGCKGNACASASGGGTLPMAAAN